MTGPGRRPGERPRPKRECWRWARIRCVDELQARRRDLQVGHRVDAFSLDVPCRRVSRGDSPFKAKTPLFGGVCRGLSRWFFYGGSSPQTASLPAWPRRYRDSVYSRDYRDLAGFGALVGFAQLTPALGLGVELVHRQLDRVLVRVDVALHRELAAVLVAHLVGDVRGRHVHNRAQVGAEVVAQLVEVEVDRDLALLGAALFLGLLRAAIVRQVRPEDAADLIPVVALRPLRQPAQVAAVEEDRPGSANAAVDRVDQRAAQRRDGGRQEEDCPGAAPFRFAPAAALVDLAFDLDLAVGEVDVLLDVQGPPLTGAEPGPRGDLDAGPEVPALLAHDVVAGLHEQR